MRGRNRDAAAIGVIALFAVLILYPFTLQGRALYWGDLLLYFYPQQELVRASLLGGKIPLWNPYIYCGQPLLANPQSWVFYPPTVLLTLLPVWLYFTVNAALHLILAGIGVYLFLRLLSLRRIAALTGALVFTGSEYLVARAQFPNMLQACAWLPWLMLGAHRVCARPSLPNMLLLSAAMALSVLSSHAQASYMSLLCALGYGAFQMVSGESRAHWRKAAAAMTGGIALGIALSSASLLPTLELVEHSTRERLQWWEANRFTLHPAQILNLVIPGAFGHPASGDYWGEGNLWETALYLGPIPVALALLAAVRARTRRETRFFAALAVLSFLLALGRFGGVYAVVYYGVPGFSSFHDPARFLLPAVFAVSLLAALGVTEVLRIRRKAWIGPALALLSALPLLAHSSRANPGIDPRALTAAAGQNGEAGRIYSYRPKDLWRTFASYADYGPATEAFLRAMRQSQVPNLPMRARRQQAAGYEPVPLLAITEVDAVLQRALFRRSPDSASPLQMMAVSRVAAPAGSPLPEFLAVRKSPPHAWLVRRAIRVDSLARSAAAVSAPGFDPSDCAIVSGAPAMSGAAPIPEDSVRILADTPHRRLARVDAGSEEAWLIWSAAFYPGWKAAVDGRPSPVARANCAFQAVRIPAGIHEATLQYEPASYRVGLFLSLTVLLVSAMAGVRLLLVNRIPNP